MRDLTCKLLVIGAGPGGYVCAIRAGQLGLDTIIVDARPPGGTCLNIGCIPSKALIHAADEFERLTSIAKGSPLGLSLSNPAHDLGKTIDWKDGIVSRLNHGVAGLLKKAGVRLVTGHARFADGKTVDVTSEAGTQRIKAENIVVATGSVPVELPFLPFGGNVISSTEALSLRALPKRLSIVGGGYIGLEIGTAFAKLGAKVTIIEAADGLLPQYPAALSKPVQKRLTELGVKIHLGARALGMSDDGKALIAQIDGAEQKIASDKVLVTVGRRPVLTGFGLAELGLEIAGPFLKIDDTCRTSMRGVYAIGDITGEPMLAHRAMAQGEMVAEHLAGLPRAWDKRCIPAVCFTDPEVVSVGLTEEAAREKGIETISGSFPFQASGRALTTEREDGFVQVVARKDTHMVLGVHAVGAGIAELSSEFALAIEMAARLEDIAATIHAHPTRSEAFQEAALGALGHALHL